MSCVRKVVPGGVCLNSERHLGKSRQIQASDSAVLKNACAHTHTHTHTQVSTCSVLVYLPYLTVRPPIHVCNRLRTNAMWIYAAAQGDWSAWGLPTLDLLVVGETRLSLADPMSSLDPKPPIMLREVTAVKLLAPVTELSTFHLTYTAINEIPTMYAYRCVGYTHAYTVMYTDVHMNVSFLYM